MAASLMLILVPTLSFSRPSPRLFWKPVLFCVSALVLLSGNPGMHAADAPDLLDPKKMLESLPREMVKEMSSKAASGIVALGDGSKKIAGLYDGKTATISFKLTRIVQYQGANNAFSEAERVRVGGTEFQINYAVYLLPSENEKAAKLRVGSKITATGTVQTEITRKENQILWLSVRGATLK